MTTLNEAIKDGLRDCMEEDPRVVVMGEDVGVLGGVFRVTDGLQKRFGDDRVIDTPLSEAGIVGTAIGMAMRGYRPVCEIQFDGFIYPAFNQITSQLAKMHARTRGDVRLPVVIRVPVSGGIGAVEHHSESNEAYFAHTAGLRVISCSTAHDAYGLIRQAVRCDDPVVFLEPKCRYWTTDTGSPDDEELPLDRARVLRTGTDVTLLTWGSMVETCLDAAKVAQTEGTSIEVVDVRSLAPADLDTLSGSAGRTGRCVVVHEAPTYGGLGAELAAAVSERCFFVLEAPVRRVGSFNTPYPPARLENAYRPDVDRVLDAVDRVLDP